MIAPPDSIISDVIMIGAAKVGSTSVFDYLYDHPAVCVSKAKELYYFLPPAERQARQPWGAIASPTDYAAQFDHRQPGQVTVELSTNYYAYPESAAIIHNTHPQAKLFMMLRDPANRAFSSYQMRSRNVGDVRPVDVELRDATSEHIQCGFYYQQLQAFLTYFPPERLKVFFFEDFVRDRETFFQDLCAYLGVDYFVPQRNYHGRPGGVLKRQWLYNLATQQRLIHKAIAFPLKLIFSAEKVQKMWESILRSNLQTATLSPELRRDLIQIYQDDITQLETLLNVDLSHWQQ